MENIDCIREALIVLADEIQFIASGNADDCRDSEAWEHRVNGGRQIARLRTMVDDGETGRVAYNLATLDVLRSVWCVLKRLCYGSHHDQPDKYRGALFLPHEVGPIEKGLPIRKANERYDPYPELSRNISESDRREAVSKLRQEAGNGITTRDIELARHAMLRVGKPHLTTKRQEWSELPDELRSLSAALISPGKSGADRQGIPSQHRTRAMSKRKAAGYLRGGNPDSAVEWLNQCIADGTITCETLSRQSHVFDCRQFPQNVQANIAPT